MTSALEDFLIDRITEDESFWRREINDLELGSIAERMLDEADAKRRIVGGVGLTLYRDFVLRTLATVYADHPDYDARWSA